MRSSASSFAYALSIVLVGSLIACGSDDDDVLFAPGGAGSGGAAGASNATKGGSGGDLGDAGTGGTTPSGKGGTGGKGGTSGKGGKGGTGGDGGSEAGGEGGSEAGGEGGSDTGGTAGKGGSAGKSGAAGKAGAGGKSGAAGTSAAGAGGNGNGGGNGAGAGGAKAGAGGASTAGFGGSGTAGSAGQCGSQPVGYFAKPLQTNLQLLFDESGSMAVNACGKSCTLGCCTGSSATLLDHAVAGAKAFLDVVPTDPPLGLGLSRMPSSSSTCPVPSSPAIALGAYPGNKAALVAAIDKLETLGSSTTGPGIDGASKHLDAALQGRAGEGRAVVVLTDGTAPTCGGVDDKNGTKAAAASLARGIPVHVIAILPDAPGTSAPRAADVALMNALAKAGGTSEVKGIVEDDDIPAQLAKAFEDVRRAAFACRFDPTPATGSFDLATAKISLATTGGELDLEAVPNVDACSGKGYYLEGKHLALCPSLCAIARQEATPALLVTPTTCSF